MLTLWDLLPKKRRKAPRKRVAQAAAAPRRTKRVTAMQQKYDRVVRESLTTYEVRVRKWRSSMSGCAWEVHGSDGSVGRLIEAPRPKGPMSAAIFLHEIGHHAIGFNRYRPRCLEEYHAWRWALEEMERQGLNVTDRVRARMRESLVYAVDKARRRGLKRLPIELLEFAPDLTERAPGTVPRN